MTSEQLKNVRNQLGLTLADFARFLGYRGKNLRQIGYNIQSGKRPLREPQRLLIQAYLDGYRPRDWGK